LLEHSDITEHTRHSDIIFGVRLVVVESIRRRHKIAPVFAIVPKILLADITFIFLMVELFYELGIGERSLDSVFC
jgi:hypothetical protein